MTRHWHIWRREDLPGLDGPALVLVWRAYKHAKIAYDHMKRDGWEGHVMVCHREAEWKLPSEFGGEPRLECSMLDDYR